jgi:[ribosomal protein S18]-alanine N-acetyltransferase
MTVLLPKIRHFQKEDLRELHNIDRICFPAPIAFSKTELLFYLNQPKSITRVAEAFGKILGFVLAHVENDNRAHIVTLDVIPDARLQKIGTTLMNEIHREIKKLGIQSITLEVGTGNYAAQRLYIGLQYECLGVLPGYYHGLEDAYRMIRRV